MKTQTVNREVSNYPKSSVTTIDLRIDKKEFQILTEDGSCIIDEVEFVEIIDLNTEMPLPVVAAPQPTNTDTPRKGIHKFASRIFNHLPFLTITLSICLVLVLGVGGNVWGQYSITSAGSGNTYNENFDAFRGTAVTLPTNWTVTTASYNTTYPILTSGAASPTVSNASGNNCYSGRASSSSSDYSILQKQGTSGSTTFTLNTINNTGSVINGFVINWNVEQFSSAGRATTVDFSYNINNGTYVQTGITGTSLFTATTGSSTTFSLVSTSRSITISGINVPNGQTANFRFTIANGTGSGSNAHIGIDDFTMYATAPATAPAAPTISSITPGNQQLSVAFTAGSDGGSAITTYKYSTNGGTNWQTRASGTTASPLLISTLSTDGTTALTNGTSYNIQIRAVNAVGDGTATASTAATPRTTPSAPTITSITPGNQQLSVAFTAGSDGGSAITTYKYSTNGGVNWQTRSAGTTASPLVISTLSTDGTTALTNGVSYDIQIRAVNAAGDGTASSTTSATPVAPVSPTLNAVTLSSSLSSTYGTASTGVSFTASGSNLTAENITATAQSGYEVSTSLGSGYGASVSVAAGTTVYVRFAPTISVGDKDNATAVVLSGGGASSNANVTTSSSGNTVSQKALTVTGLTAQSKVYDGLTSATATGTAALSGVVSPDVVSLTGTPTFSFTSANVGTGISVTTSGYSLTGGDSANYILTQPTLSANITLRSLTITANDVNKYAGVALTGGSGSTAFTASGLQNSETIGSVTITYGSAGASTGDGNTFGVYASQVTPSVATGGTFTAGNYSISYVAGSITVLEAPVAILEWNTYGNSGTETTEPSVYNDPNIASAILTQGSITPAANSNRFGGSNWWNTGDATNSTIANAIAGNDYIQFIVTPNSGSVFTPTSFVFNWDKSSSGPQNVALRSSVDNFESDLGTISPTAAIGTSNTITISGLSNISTATTFRIYGYGGTATGGTGGFDVGSNVVNVQLNGYVKSVPQLSTPTSTSIATTSATLGATITSDGGTAITSRGTVYGTSSSPTTNSLAEGGTSVAAFSHSRTSLTANTFYYYRGYAVNSVGTGYSADGTLTTLHNAPTVGSGSNATATTIDASWSAPSGGSATFTYEIEVDDNNDFSSPAFTQSSISSATTTITATGLTSNTTYYFRVRANNAGGSSAWSSTSTGYATLIAVTPTLSTTALTAFGDVCLNVTSSANSFTINGSALTSADVTVSTLSGYTFSTTEGGTYTNSLTLSQVGGTYSQAIFVKFTPTAVQSYDGNIVVSGGGASSSENVAASGSGIAGAVNVTTTTVSFISTTGASSGGSSLSTSCGTITSIGVAYGTSANPTTPVTSDGSGPADYSSTLTGLTPNTEYNYRAYATNSNGVTSYGSNLTFTTLHNAPTVGTGTLATTTGFTANWTAPTGGGSATFTYEVAVSTSPTFASTLITQLGISSASTSYQFTSLSYGTTYYFRVRANNAGGSSEWSEISASISTLTVFENYETGSKGSYTAGDVSFNSGSWNLNNALIGTSTSDRKYGSQSVRIQSTGIVSMNFDVTNGISSLTIYHGLYGTDANSTWRLEVSNNGGITWDAFISSDISTTSTTLAAQSFNIDLCGTLRFRIVKLTGNRLNIDEIVLIEKAATPNAPSASAQSFCSSASPTVADLTVNSGSAIKWYDASTNGNLLASGTALVAGNYYASQTVSGCESNSRTSVSVTLNSNGTWVGDSNDDWNIAGNWCGGVPNSSSAVVSVPSGVTVNLDASPSVLNLTIGNGATINAGTYTINIADGGSFENNGTFNAGTSTIAFSGAGTLGGNTTTFNNLSVNGTLTINTSPMVNGTVTINNGGSVTSNPIIYGSSASLVYNVNSTITSTHHEWPATSSPYNVTIQNNSVVTINDDKVVDGTLTLTSGKLTLGDKNLTINGTINGGSANCFINTNTNNTNNNNQGALIRSVNTTGVNYSFPIGRDAVYSPLTLTFNPGTTFNNTTISATTHNSKVSNLNSNHTHYLERHWIVEPNTTISNLNYDISLTVNPSEVVGSGDFSDLRPVKYSGGSWYRPTGTNFLDGIEQGTSSSPIGNTLTWQGLSTFSEFGGVGDGAMPLPVELLSLNASCVEDQNTLTWQTASEHNSSYFDIEKSRDGQSWNVIGQQIAAGNSTELLSYQFVDLEKNNSRVYYRLNQVDIDGENEYFGPVALDCYQNDFEATSLPNPSNGNFWIKIQSNESSSAELKLLDVKGNVLLTNDVMIQEGINVYPITPILKSGMYFIHIQNTKDQKITVLKHLQN